MTNAVDLLERLNLKIVQNQIRVQAANGAHLTCIGFAYIPFTFNNKTKVIPTAIIPELSKDLILGTDFWKAFDIHLSIGGKPVPEGSAIDFDVNSISHVAEYDTITSVSA